MLLFSSISLVKVQIVWLIEKRELHPFVDREGINDVSIILQAENRLTYIETLEAFSSAWKALEIQAVRNLETCGGILDVGILAPTVVV
jgi:hypothetical protein